MRQLLPQHLLFLLSLSMAAPATAQMDGLFAPWSDLLDEHLIEQPLEGGGLVSAFQYREALEDDTTHQRLSEQREALAGFDTDSLKTREQATAFWLNAYNFFMAAHILEERPDGELVDSVWDYGGRLNPFRTNVFERELFDVGGTMMSLDGIEKDTLLGEAFRQRGWADARVHFAVNCASVGCPPLRSVPYTADNLDELLRENTRKAFLTHYQLRVENDTLFVSSLFDWYEADFLAEADSIRDFIAHYADKALTGQVRGTSRTEFIDYDWRLNSPEHYPEIP
ncbi:MAG: DUF547 domain-containing protein [Pseudomonadota bacterium]